MDGWLSYRPSYPLAGYVECRCHGSSWWKHLQLSGEAADGHFLLQATRNEIKPLRSWPRALLTWKKGNKSWVVVVVVGGGGGGGGGDILNIYPLPTHRFFLFRSPIAQLPQKRKERQKNTGYFLHTACTHGCFPLFLFHPQVKLLWTCHNDDGHPWATFHLVVGPPPRRMPGLESWTKHQMPRAGEICASRCWRCSSSVVWSWWQLNEFLEFSSRKLGKIFTHIPIHPKSSKILRFTRWRKRTYVFYVHP